MVVGRGERTRAGAALISRCVAPGEGRAKLEAKHAEGQSDQTPFDRKLAELAAMVLRP